jgi:hypothetical protein
MTCHGRPERAVVKDDLVVERFTASGITAAAWWARTLTARPLILRSTNTHHARKERTVQ